LGSYDPADDERQSKNHLAPLVVAEMVTLLITSLVILAFVAVAFYFWQKPASPIESEALPPSEWRGLFIDVLSDNQNAGEDEAELADKSRRRAAILDRAAEGDKSALQEARNSEDSELYEEVLNTLLGAAESGPNLLALVSYITRHELTVTKKLAERFIDSCNNIRDAGTTAKMLHLAALSNDAGVYQRAMETALEFWRAGHLSNVSARELRSVIEGEFWILSSTTRSSGAGFLLKRALSRASRELEEALK
jgi:hypothetical protein